MFDRLRKALRYGFGYRTIEIQEETPEILVLRCGGTRTIFVKSSAQILQNGKLAGLFSAIEGIELHQSFGDEGPPNWFVSIQLRAAMRVEIGQTTDQLEASIVGARISTLTGRPVVIRT